MINNSKKVLKMLTANVAILALSTWTFPTLAGAANSEQAAGHICKLYNQQDQLVGLVDAKYGKVGVPTQNGRIAVAGVIFSQEFSDDMLITIAGLAQGVPMVTVAGKVTVSGEVFKYNWHNGAPAVGRVDLATKRILNAQGQSVGKFDGCDADNEDFYMAAGVGGAAEILGFFGRHIVAMTMHVCPAGACEW